MEPDAKPLETYSCMLSTVNCRIYFLIYIIHVVNIKYPTDKDVSIDVDYKGEKIFSHNQHSKKDVKRSIVQLVCTSARR